MIAVSLAKPNCPGGYIHCWECKEKNTCPTAAEIKKQQWEENCAIVRDVIGVKNSDSDFSAFWQILEWWRQEEEDAWADQPTREEYEARWEREDAEDCD